MIRRRRHRDVGPILYGLALGSAGLIFAVVLRFAIPGGRYVFAALGFCLGVATVLTVTERKA
ncbi:MAG TPA: hypothetical protein VF377_10400 [Acidimicrobiia bacterium]